MLIDSFVQRIKMAFIVRIYFICSGARKSTYESIINGRKMETDVSTRGGP